MDDLKLLCDIDDYEYFCRVVEKSEYLQKRIKEIANDRIEFCVGLLHIRDFDSVEEYLERVKEICRLFSDDLICTAFENDWLLEDANGDFEEILVDTNSMTAYRLKELK